jgi:hypothetical protein
LRAEDHSLVGRWIAKETEIEEYRPWVRRVLVDVTFILEGKESASLLVVLKDDHQKADNAVASTHLWTLFFKESFFSRFMISYGRPGPWKRGVKNVYCQHPWNQRSGMPPGWEGAMNSFRRMGFRWWQRNLLRMFRAWRRRHGPDPRTGREVAPHNLVVFSRSDGHYVWQRAGKGLLAYKAQWDCLHQKGKEGPRTMKVAWDAMGQVARPHERFSPDYLDGWWDWASGSRPFFWNWQKKYSWEVRDG